VTVIASEAGAVVGFARLLTDGEIHAYLANVVVAHDQRRRGVGKRLVEEAFSHSRAERLDLFAGEGATRSRSPTPAEIDTIRTPP
jgi:ribosomal protein S18 acetylase RimI-like enzyme